MTSLLAAATGTHAWLAAGGARAPIRAALIRFWTRHGVLRLPVPLTGAAALRAETASAPAAWLTAFLDALAGEATDGRTGGRQLLMDHGSRTGLVRGARRRCRAAARLACRRGDRPLGGGRGRGRPPVVAIDEDVVAGPAAAAARLTPIDCRAFDYSGLELGMAQLDLVLGRARRPLDTVAPR